MRLVVVAMVIPIVSSAHEVRAETSADVFEAGIDAHIAEIHREFERNPPSTSGAAVSVAAPLSNRLSRTIPNAQAGARQQALDDENSSALPKLASVAFKTEVKDTEAGLVVAPLVLLGNGSELARNLAITAAALKDDKFRAGASIAIPLRDPTLAFERLGLDYCKFDDVEYRKMLRDRTDDYAATCAAISVIPYPDADPVKKARTNLLWLQGFVACGLSIPAPVAAKWDPQKLADVVKANQEANLISHVTAVIELAKTAASQPRAVADRFEPLKPSLERLAKLQTAPTQTSCLDDEDITRAATQAKWEMPMWTLAFSARGDFFALQFGFDPDGMSSSHRLAEHEERAELRYSAGRSSLTVGVGVKGAREEAPDPLITSVRPAGSAQWVAVRLDGKKLYDEKGRLAVRDNGDLPPLLVVGLDAVLGVTIHNQPASQESRIDEVGVTAYLDFRVNEDVAFRLGVPVKAEIATRKADATMMPPVTEKKALQWTVPLFLTTVLEI